MPGIVYIIGIAIVAFAIYKFIKGDNYSASDDEFKQANVKVVFSTGKITIGKTTYNIDDVQAIEWQRHGMTTTFYIKVDDFKKPIHKVYVTDFGGEGSERFRQRLFAAIRKAGGLSFS
jgi:hypothetical protein